MLCVRTRTPFKLESLKKRCLINGWQLNRADKNDPGYSIRKTLKFHNFRTPVILGFDKWHLWKNSKAVRATSETHKSRGTLFYQVSLTFLTWGIMKNHILLDCLQSVVPC